MMPLAGHRVLAMGAMVDRPLARLLSSLGAEIVAGTPTTDVASFEFAIDDLGLPNLAAAGWIETDILRDHPALVHGSVTPFGSIGPCAQWQGSELVAAAAGGTLRLTGYPDRRPVKEALDACVFHADMVTAAGMMAAHFARGTTGKGQHVDVSVQEVAFNRNVSGVLGWQFDGRKSKRVGPALNYGLVTVRCIWPLSDGWCFHSLMTGRFGAPANQALSDWIDETDLDNPIRDVDWLKYNRSTLDAETRAAWERGIERFFRTRTKAELASEGRRRGINACVVAEPADILNDPHLEARNFWSDSDDFRQPTRFVRIVPGTRSDIGAGESSVSRGPLTGLRVLDFSWALVGSIATKTLGDLGATVVKVESRHRPCLSRIDVQVRASNAGNFDDKPWFAHLNTSKLSLALNMKHPRAMDVVGPLIDWADVVVENFSPGTMDKLGLGFDTLKARKPGIIMVSGSVYGQTGPLAAEWGVDGTGGALSGRTFLTGWADRDPVVPGSVPYGDAILPFVMAAATLATVQARRSTGQGAHIDASMYEVCVQQMMQAVQSAQEGARPYRAGNADPGIYHQDVYPAVGQDRWVAITLHSPVEEARLTDLAGTDDIASWTSSQDERDIVDKLQSAGIAAAVVQDIEDLVERDPTIAARGALVQLDHPLLGAFGHMRTPITFSATPGNPYRAPSLGEHCQRVACDIGGLSTAEFGQLGAEGLFE